MARKAVDILDLLSRYLGCDYLSDLRRLDSCECTVAAKFLDRIPVESASLREWNDVLVYLTGTVPCETREGAKRQLIALLS